MINTTRILPALLLSLAVACSGGGGDDGGDPNPGGPDAGSSNTPDAAPRPDAGDPVAVCSYTESNDSGNDVVGGGAAEATNLTFSESGGEIVLCGRIDPANAVAGAIADADFFDFAVSGNEDDQIPFRITLSSPQGDSLAGFGLQLSFLPDGADPVTVTSASYEDGYALATNSFFIPGTFQFLVLAGDDPLPAAPIDYEIRISKAPACDADTNAPGFTEADEAPDHRANDLVSLSFVADEPLSLTAAEDAPETTGMTLTAGTNVHIAGSSADVEAEDSYLDRDTYLVTTDAQVNELDIRLSWPDGDADLDLMAFLEDAVDIDLELSGFGGLMEGTEDEFITVRVPPESNLWVWAATFDDGPANMPVGYDLTICPRSFTP